MIDNTQIDGPCSPIIRDVLTLAELEKQHIANVLTMTNWHQGRTADILGISVKTLYRRLREYGWLRGHQLHQLCATIEAREA